MNDFSNTPSKALRDWMAAKNISQADIAEMLGVSRTAVSKWCAGTMSPSEDNADVLHHASFGAVPATIWPRRRLPEAQTKGARALRKAADKRGVTIFELSRQIGVPERGMHRWACSLNAPRVKTLAHINKKLGLNLRLSDFEVAA